MPDGRYLARDEDGERVLAIVTIGAPPPPRRRRRRPKDTGTGDPVALPLTRVTAIRAHEPFESEAEAGEWLAGALASEDSIDATVAAGLGLLNRALHAHAVASANPLGAELAPEQAATVRIGHGSGKEVAAGRFTEARTVDARSPGGSRRRQRDEELRP
ncbi:MAG: hypothetical protein WA687_03430, partial [Solirubrobacterales bacterium]